MATIYDTQPDWYRIARDSFSGVDRLSSGRLALAKEELQARRAEEALRLELAMRGEANTKIQELANRGRLEVQRSYNEARAADRSAGDQAAMDRLREESANAEDRQRLANLGRWMTTQQTIEANQALATQTQELQGNLAPIAEKAWETINTAPEKFKKIEEELNGMVTAAREGVPKSPQVAEAIRLAKGGFRTSYAQDRLVEQYVAAQNSAAIAVVDTPAYQLKAAAARSILDGVTASYRLLEGWGIRAPGAFEDSEDWVNSMPVPTDSDSKEGGEGVKDLDLDPHAGPRSTNASPVGNNDYDPYNPFPFHAPTRKTYSSIPAAVGGVLGDVGDNVVAAGSFVAGLMPDISGGSVPRNSISLDENNMPVFPAGTRASQAAELFGPAIQSSYSNIKTAVPGITIHPPEVGPVNPHYAIGPAEAAIRLQQPNPFPRPFIR